MKNAQLNSARESDQDDIIQIAGAGPSGLAAAITLAKSGYRVQVHEAKECVGFRFKRDLQGLENWTTRQDVLAWLDDYGISTDFRKYACHQGTGFDYKRRAYEFNSEQPLFYLVERGPREGSLDHALLCQAQDLGVEVKFNSRLRTLEGKGILATGPRGADAIAVGFHFETDMENGFWFICDDDLAPQGYSYLLVMNGVATIKTCMFSGFKQEKKYVERTVRAFEELLDIKMINPQSHGGAGNFMLVSNAIHGRHPVVGEQAGFQDTLWGFGMRHAITSGVLAAQSLINGSDYNELWKQAFAEQIKTSIVNRGLFTLLGNRGYSFFMRKLSASSNTRAALYRHYHSMWIKKLLYPWANRRYKNKRGDQSCHQADCSCVVCRCG